MPKPKRRYKPVERKVRPVPTYRPDPTAPKFKPIPFPNIQPLPTHPPPRATLEYNDRITSSRLDIILSTIEPDFLSEQEIDLLAFVVVERSHAFAFNFKEKGMFDPQYYPDYEIATIEHTPWQMPPIRCPKAIEENV
ncbi:hypothetical protein BJ165DRAFT_1338916, partial [Panaeolus papilionaceus]